jgi:hypothetical protein
VPFIDATVDEVLAHYQKVDQEDWIERAAVFRKLHVARAFAEAIKCRLAGDTRCVKMIANPGSLTVTWTVTWDQKQKGLPAAATCSAGSRCHACWDPQPAFQMDVASLNYSSNRKPQ